MQCADISNFFQGWPGSSVPISSGESTRGHRAIASSAGVILRIFSNSQNPFKQGETKFRKRGPKICQMIQTGQSPSKSTLSNLSDISFVPIQSFMISGVGFHQIFPLPPLPPPFPSRPLPSNSYWGSAVPLGRSPSRQRLGCILDFKKAFDWRSQEIEIEGNSSLPISILFSTV